MPPLVGRAWLEVGRSVISCPDLTDVLNVVGMDVTFAAWLVNDFAKCSRDGLLDSPDVLPGAPEAAVEAAQPGLVGHCVMAAVVVLLKCVAHLVDLCHSLGRGLFATWPLRESDAVLVVMFAPRPYVQDFVVALGYRTEPCVCDLSDHVREPLGPRVAE